MHPRTAELVEYAESQRATLLAALSLVPESLRERRVLAGAWSAAEVLEHLYRVERSVSRLLARAVERAAADGIPRECETGSVMGSLDVFQLAWRGSRINAPEAVLPRGELSAGQALAALAESRRALLSALRAGDGLALGQLAYPHPLLGKLNLYQWVLFVGQHEARHAAQIREIAQALGPEIVE